MISYDSWREILKEQRLPLAAVDLDAFDRNVAAVAGLARGKLLRVATKSIRVPELIRRVLAYGPPYRGLMCYSADEALKLAGKGFDDFLIAYPTLQKSDLKALHELHVQGKKVALVADCIWGIKTLACAMFDVKTPFRVVLEVDMSLRVAGQHLGVRRSPLRRPEDLAPLLDEAAKYPYLAVVGAMGYEAQVAGVGDRNPFKRLMNPIVSLMRRASVRSVARRRQEFAKYLESCGVSLKIFNGGGTGSLSYAAHEPWLTELAAGSGFLCPHLFDYYSNLKLEPAAFFALQTVRASDDGMLTCQGGGYVASGEPGWDKVPRPWLPEGARLVSMEGCGEVQTPIHLSRDRLPKLGDPILFRHAKAGELAERFDEYVLVSGGKITGRAKSYRGLGWNFF